MRHIPAAHIMYLVMLVIIWKVEIVIRARSDGTVLGEQRMHNNAVGQLNTNQGQVPPVVQQ
jgi:hypothetical protein